MTKNCFWCWELDFCVALFLQSELQKHYDDSKIISDAPMFTSMLPDDEENEKENEHDVFKKFETTKLILIFLESWFKTFIHCKV